MEELKNLRDKIDEIDTELVSLFQERMKISEEVADYKISTGKKVFDQEREREKIKTVTGMAKNDFNRHGIEELFTQIMSMSRKLQYQLLAKNGVIGRLPFIAVDEIERSKVRVVYQGVEGAYSQAAMKQFFREDITSFHVPHWRDAMEAIAEGSADFAVLPIENSTAGSVNDMYDLLVEFENYIVGEQIIRCEHNLLGLPDAELSDIREVYSHPQALSQCKDFLRSHREWKQVPMENTAAAAKKVRDDQDKTRAAISSAFAGECFGLKVLKKDIPITFLQFLVFVDQDLCRVKVQLVVDGEPLDQRDVRLLALALADLDLLDQPVEPEAHGRIGHAVHARDLLE